MNFREFDLGGKKLRISDFSDNAVRIRISSDFKPTYFERYGIYNEPDENAGELLTNGIKAGDLAVTYENGVITMKSPRFERTISLDNSAVAEKSKLFNEKLTDFRPERKKIVGDTSEDEPIEYVNFEKDPKYITVKTDGEIFYGLGESNTDRIVLNGRTYLERVIYVRSEIVIPFLMTKAGYGILCNSTIWHGVDVCDENKNEICWFLPDGDIDFYLFAGDSLKAILERFTYVTGRPMVLPKWGYGLTFIDQYFADQFEVMHNAEKFREKKIPCDTFSLEPGWMGGYDFSTQKKWYTQRFYICDWMRRTDEEFAAHTPRERQFTTALNRYGFKLLLWLCCKYDFTANQENRAGNPADFGIEPWYKHLKSFVCDGASGFKMDPCKVVDTATETRVYANGEGEPYMHSLQCTLYGKEMYEGYSEYTGLRPMHHMSGGYTSMSRYSATTTGDSGGKHKTLVWILNSGLSGMSNITCDMDIFAKHTIHYCFFTAWCQLNSWSGYSHPWWAGDELEAIFTFYDKLRYRLLPYIYSAAIESHISGTPVVRAMPLEFDDKALVNATCEYMFGDSMLVGSFSDTIYLPEGEVWINAWNGELLSGGREVNIDVPENRGGPLYIRGGAIIPTQAEKQFTDCKDDEHLTLEIYPVEACNTAYTLYEDDGRTQAYLAGERAKTEFTLRMICGKAILTIGRREGSFDGMAAERSYGVKAYAVAAPKAVFVDGKAAHFTYADGFVSFEAGTASEAVIEF